MPSLKEDGPARRALGSAAEPACWTGSRSSPSRSRTTRSGTRPGGRSTCTARPGVDRGRPASRARSVYVIQGFTGQVDMWLARAAFEPTIIERLDAMFAARRLPRRDRRVRRRVDLAAAAPSSSTRPSTGRYLDYLCDEVVPFVDERYPTLAARDHRGLTGKSSGGYGAMVVPMLRPDVFGALASHAGDALFECCYLPRVPGRRRAAARPLRRLLRGVLRAPAPTPTIRLERFGEPSRCTATRARTRRTPSAPARRCCRSTSPRGGWSTRSGRAGSS